MILRLLILLCWASTSIGFAADWSIALPGYHFEFPRDHRAHPNFKTEWWYFTGNLTGRNGEEFGYQLTFFRQGVNSEHAVMKPKSRFVVPEFYFAHFAVTDVANNQYRHQQKVRRGVFEDAGVAKESGKIVWIDNWEMVQVGTDSFEIRAASDEMAIDLTVSASKPIVIHGENGVSQKAQGAGNASHYYSYTRMATKGLVRFRGKQTEVTGQSWMDREWATNQLGENQAGWDWFSIQLDSGEELMLYRMRLKSGGSDPMSSGTLVAKEGKSSHLRRDDFILTPLRQWKSPETGIAYPIAWKAKIPSLGMELTIEAAVDRQELAAEPVTYWEGAIVVRGTQGGKTVTGKGYLELTGYGSALEQL